MTKRKPADPVKVQQVLLNRIRAELETTNFEDIPAQRLTAFASILRGAAPALEKKAEAERKAKAIAKAAPRLPTFEDDIADEYGELPAALGEQVKTPRELLAFVAPTPTPAAPAADTDKKSTDDH